MSILKSRNKYPKEILEDISETQLIRLEEFYNSVPEECHWEELWVMLQHEIEDGVSSYEAIKEMYRILQKWKDNCEDSLLDEQLNANPTLWGASQEKRNEVAQNLKNMQERLQ